MFDKFQNAGTAAVAALLFATTFVSAAVGPARSVETQPVSYAAASLASAEAHA